MEFDDGEQDFSLFTSFESDSSHTMSFLNQKEWREQPKLAKTHEAMAIPKPPTNGEQMLSFSPSSSSSSSFTPNVLMGNTTNSLFPYHYHHPSSYSASPSSSASYYRNGGMVLRSTNVSMHGMRGPFTPSQWMELEYQALIYKHMEANAPIPRNLLFPIWRSLNPSGLSTYPQSGPFRSTTLGWGSYNPGFSGYADVEPGRCRRTDGKKWRCSRDTVADQKYCERHMNRGRHRSRKLVEGRSCQASPSAPVIACSSQSTSAGSGGPPPNGLNMDPSPSQFNRILMRKENTTDCIQDSQALSLLISPTPKPANILFPISKHHNPFEGTSSQTDFVLESSYSENIHLENQNSQTYPLRHFINDWPKSQHDHQQPITWPELEDSESDGTDLSISIPTDSNQEKLALSPLRLSREFTPIKISWEPSMGGPLGEALTNMNSNPKGTGKNLSCSSLNLLTDGWDLSSRLESSPTGVLQKTTFGSVSSSTGSSPRAENGKSNLCDDFLSSSLVSPLIVPSLQAL